MDNKHIEEYLDYYCSLKVAPNYAIMLRGKWGCGKSWFINNYIKVNTHFKYLYVSLNGMTKTKEIEGEFFRQLHPWLSSKRMKVAGKLFKGLVKTAIKVDLNGDGKDDASVSSTMPDIELTEFFNNAEGRILIFDDLERCGIPITQILGYINQFVELYGLKVIVISNEEEIISKENEKPYKAIKEKLFGRSFDIASDIDSALTEFIKQVNNDNTKLLLTQKKSDINEIYESSNYNNLRQLRQAVLDFSRFADLLPENCLKTDDLFIRILSIFFAISFELKKGVLDENQIGELLTFQLMKKSDDKDSSYIAEIKSKYSVFDSYPYPISSDLWRDYFRTGTVEKKAILESIEKTYFQKNNSPDFIKLWHQYDLEDEEFESIYNKVYKKFNAKEISDKCELLHVVGILLSLADRKLIQVKKETIVKQAKICIRYLAKQGLLFVDENEEFPGFASYGLCYTYRESLEYKETVEYFNKEILIAKSVNEKILAEELLKLFSVSVYDFLGEVVLNNHTGSKYFRTPILKHIKPRKFVDAYLNHLNKDKKHFAWRFDQRYKWPDYNKELVSELEWLKDVEKLVLIEREKRRTKISGSNLDFFLQALKKSTELLESMSV